MPFLRWLLRAVRVLAGILAVPFGLLAVFALVCSVIGVMMVFMRDESWSAAGTFALVGVGSALISWGLYEAAPASMRDKGSDALEVVEVLHAVGQLCLSMLRGVSAAFRVFR